MRYNDPDPEKTTDVLFGLCLLTHVIFLASLVAGQFNVYLLLTEIVAVVSFTYISYRTGK